MLFTEDGENASSSGLIVSLAASATDTVAEDEPHDCIKTNIAKGGDQPDSAVCEDGDQADTDDIAVLVDEPHDRIETSSDSVHIFVAEDEVSDENEQLSCSDSPSAQLSARYEADVQLVDSASSCSSSEESANLVADEQSSHSPAGVIAAADDESLIVCLEDTAPGPVVNDEAQTANDNQTGSGKGTAAAADDVLSIVCLEDTAPGPVVSDEAETANDIQTGSGKRNCCYSG